MTIEENIAQLKRLVNALTYQGDDLVFDKALAEIDLVIFDLRQECFVTKPPPGELREPIKSIIQRLGLVKPSTFTKRAF